MTKHQNASFFASKSKFIEKWNELSFILLASCLFLAPSNLFLKLLPQTGYVHNLQIDYLIPKLHLSFLFLLLFVTTRLPFVLFNSNKYSQVVRKNKYWLLGLTALFIHQSFDIFPVTALWTFGSLLLFLAFYRVVKSFVFILPKSRQHLLVWVLYFTLLFQALLGIFQFLTQHSLSGFLPLGEININGQPYLARGDFYFIDSIVGTSFGQRVLPYGTLPHPNVLAGFLAVGMIVLFYQFTIKNWLKSMLMLPLLVTLFLTLSLSAWMTLLLGLLFLYFRTKILFQSNSIWFAILGGFFLVPVLLGIWSLNLGSSLNTSITRRVILNEVALKELAFQPVFGVGFNHFTVFLERFQHASEVVAFVQPAHHVGLLMLAELGIVGTGLILWLMKKITKLNRQTMLFLAILFLPIASLDHYLFTLIQGWWLVVIAILFLKSNSTR